MVPNKLSDYLLLVKLLLDSQEALLEYQSKIDAMGVLVLEKDLIDYPSLKLHIYLQALSDSVGRAVSIAEDLMGSLNKITTLLMVSEDRIIKEDKLKSNG